uniref:Uncharacterized protein n=1 Tax=Anguilla anguilla TaxID=7936 RepID=A0A0E9QM08_ANGAN
MVANHGVRQSKKEGFCILRK